MLSQIYKNQKLMKNVLSRHGQKWVWPVWSWDYNTDSISKMNRLNKLPAGANSGKLKVDSMIFGWALSKMAMTFKFMRS